MSILIKAKCGKHFQDKNGNDCIALQLEFGESVVVRKQYCSVVPAEGESCIVRVTPREFEGKAFLTYSVVSRV